MVSDDKGRDSRKSMLEIQGDDLDSDLSFKDSSGDDSDMDDLNYDGDGDLDPELNIDMARRPERSSGGGLSRFIAPVLVLVAAAGVGGYIVTHPEIIGGGQPAQVEMAAQTPAAADPSTNSNEIALADSDISETLPQPTATQNNASESVTEAPALPADVPQPEVASAEAAQPVTADQALEQGDAADPLIPAPPVSDKPEEQVAATPTPGEEVTEESGVSKIEVAQAETPAASPALSAPPDPLKEKMAEPIPVPEAPASETPKAAADESAPRGPIPVADKDVPMPDAGNLKAAQPAPPPVSGQPGDAAFVPPPISPKQGAEATSAATPSPDAYFDASVGVPAGNMATVVGPRKVDPIAEPGQKFVVVEGVRKADDAESMLVAASRALKLGRNEAALEMYNGLYAKNDRDPRILMGRAVAQQNLGMSDAAIQSYEALLKLDSDNADAMVNMLGVLKTKDPQSALARMVQLQGQFPSHPGLNAQIGISQGELGNYQEAMRSLGMAATLQPSNPQHLFNMAVLADRQKDIPTAIKMYEQALQVDAVNAGSGQGVPRESIYDRLAVLRRQ